MKRYRVLIMKFDTRANLLELEIQEDWEPLVRERWQQSKNVILDGLANDYGSTSFEQKLNDFRAIGISHMSVVAFHNRFFKQARDAFVIGAYYPALTAACALGERILNHMILMFRDDFRDTQEYRRVRGKDSFDNWHIAIETLVAWRILLPDTAKKFKELCKIRNRNLHFKPETDTNTRDEALAALHALHAIVELQFSAFGSLPWFLSNARGMSLIRKEYESDPFVRKIVLPCCALVGPCHQLQSSADGTWLVEDIAYSSGEVSDDDFVAALDLFHSDRVAALAKFTA